MSSGILTSNTLTSKLLVTKRQLKHRKQNQKMNKSGGGAAIQWGALKSTTSLK